MVGRVLIVLDGAPEPGGPTTLETARTPALDRLCRRGTVSRLRTTPAGLEPGSETGIPTLLGGERVWRLDLRDGEGRRVDTGAPRAVGRRGDMALHAAVAERLPRHRVVRLRGHRLLLGLDVRMPPAVRAAGDGRDVVVHVGALDEAAQRHNRAAKRLALERIDAELIGPLAAVADLIAVTADHSTCPRTGRHGAEPVPLVVAGDGIAPRGPKRLTERAAAVTPVASTPWDAALAEVAA